MDQSPILSVTELAVSYRTRKGDVNAVRDVSFTIGPGESLGLVGESGSGKSTVAYSIVDFLGPNGRIVNGSVLFRGHELRSRSPGELRKLLGPEISMVYQEPMSSLNPTMRIQDQLMETLVAHRQMAKSDARNECMAALDRVHMPDVEGVMRRYPHQLSGGQQQRVLIAMAMLNNPSLLIMDEPTTALDVTVEAAVLDLVAELKAKYRMSTLYISHNLGVVARVADKVAVMYAGEVVELASANEIFRNPAHPYTRGLIRCLPDVDVPHGERKLYPIPGQVPSPANIPPGCIFSPRCQHAGRDCNLEHPRLVEVAPGHLARCARTADWIGTPLFTQAELAAAKNQAAADEQSPDLLVVKGVRSYYPVPYESFASLIGREKRRYVRAVDGVSLSVGRGRTLGIVGESGCGKSTLAKTIVGLEPPSGGRIEFLGVDIAKPLRKRGIGTIKELQMVFQDPNGVLNPSYSVGDQIAVSLERFKTVPKNQVHDEVVRLLKLVKLDGSYYWRLPRQLSGGEKQRVGIARAIASNPSMVICDEPVSALDVSVQAAVLTLLMDIQQQRNTTMILISHDLASVRLLSDWVMVMYLGRVMEVGPCESIYSPPSHPYTEALLAAIPRPNTEQTNRQIRLAGSVPSAVNPPSGCRFHTRCPHMMGNICQTEEPPEVDFGGGHKIYCHLPKDILYQE